MSVALKHDIAKPFKGESHDDDATFLFLFAGATGVGLKIDTAEAIVGRPATPRSAAGVARRTVRRRVY
jgi:hypothetical protein